MLSRLGKSLRIGLSRTGITLLRSERWWYPRSTVVADYRLPTDEPALLEDWLQTLGDILAEHKDRCVNLPTAIVLSDNWVRMFMATPPHNAMRLQDCRAAAFQRFQILYDDSVTDWHLAADWSAKDPFLAVAIPRSLLDGLCQRAFTYNLKLVYIAPQFVAAWNRWRRAFQPNSWFAVRHENVLTLGAIDQQRLSAVRTVSLPADVEQAPRWLHEQIGREALRLNVPVPSHLQLVGGTASPWARTTESLLCTKLDAASHNSDDPSGILLARTGIA